VSFSFFVLRVFAPTPITLRTVETNFANFVNALNFDVIAFTGWANQHFWGLDIFSFDII
jgi:hypothetical protein